MIVQALRAAIILGGSALLLASLAAFCGAWVWWLDLLAHFRQHYVLLALLLAALALALRSWPGGALAMLALAVNLAALLQISTAEARDTHDRVFTVATFNILGDNDDIDAISAWLDAAKPDLVMFEELSPLAAVTLARIRPDYRYRFLVPKAGSTGIGVLSRYPLEDAHIDTIASARFPLLHAKVNVEGAVFEVIGVHPPVPFGAAITVVRDQIIARAGALARAAPGRAIVLGDFNASLWSLPMRRLQANAGLRAAKQWPDWTFTPLLPRPLRIAIDHILVSPDLDVSDPILGAPSGSDHFPVTATIRYKSAN